MPSSPTANTETLPSPLLTPLELNVPLFTTKTKFPPTFTATIAGFDPPEEYGEFTMLVRFPV